MNASLAPGERIERGTEVALARAFARPDVAAVLVPLVPDGDGRLARAARRYMAAWDARFLHDQTFFAPGARAAFRDASPPGPRAADAAPHLARAIDEGRRVVALQEGAVVSPIARSLDAWVGWAREEGEAWGRLAARDSRFAPYSPALTRAAWWKHNAVQVSRRVGEATQALRRFDPLAAYLHVVREATWSGSVVRAFSKG